MVLKTDSTVLILVLLIFGYSSVAKGDYHSGIEIRSKIFVK